MSGRRPAAVSALVAGLWLGLGGVAVADEEAVTGFSARIGGAYSAEITAEGVLVYLPTGGWERKGTYFLADAQGLRPHGITFTLPRDIAPGQHELENPTPFEAGTVVSVRVDRDLGDATLSAQRNASGYLILESFPQGATEPNGAEVAGSFAFATEFPDGERIEAEGTFSFRYR